MKDKFSSENSKNHVVVIASGSNDRDGIGIEISIGNELIVEIFRDDELQRITMTLFEDNIPLEFIEKSIAVFRKEIPEEFM